MPLNVRRFCTSIVLVFAGLIAAADAQAPVNAGEALQKAPSAAEVMRERISKAKAYIAVRNYSAAIFELENIRKETNDTSVHAVTNVLLMNSYLEKGDYTRAQDFLKEFHAAQKANKPNSTEFYASIAGQAVKGARQQVERYRGLGLTVSDRNLPLQAVNEIEQMRETLELVVEQTKETGKDKAKAGAAMALLEEAATTRSILARDDYDARRWRDELTDSREQLLQSRSVVISAVETPGAPREAAAEQAVAMNTASPVPVSTTSANAPSNGPAFQPVAAEASPAVIEKPAAEPKPAVQEPKSEPASQPARTRMVPNTPVKEALPKADEPKEEKPAAQPAAAVPAGPLDIGSLIGYATSKPGPSYPATARNLRTTGVVRVEVVVDENGEVAEVETSSGPALLKGAAEDAVKKWKFRPFLRDGQPVRAKGYVNFNFTL